MKNSFREYKFDLNKSRDMSLFGAFPSGGFVRFTLKLKCDAHPRGVNMVVHADGWNDGFEVRKSFPLMLDNCMSSSEDLVFSIDIDFARLLGEWGLSEEGLLYYHYSLYFDDREIELGGENPTELCIIENSIGERQLLIYRADYNTSSAFRDGVIYHVFVDRFRRSGMCGVKKDAVLNPDWNGGVPQFGEYPGAEVENNVFFGGDLYGIIEKLDYISSLGVKTIYLSPVFDAYSNHKYDVGDYLNVDSMFGGNIALAELCRAARSHGINIILDGVFNHTGADSVYFNKYGRYQSVGAYKNESSPYRQWYKFGTSCDDYECWWGVKILPRVDSDNLNFGNFIFENVVDKWMSIGVFGWRLDVADELSENFLKKFRSAVKKRNSDGVIIGEVWEDATDKVSYGKRRSYLCGGELDSVMNYPLRNAVIEYVKNGNCELFRRYTEGTYRRYPKCSSDNLMNFLGTHDTERIITLLGGEEAGDKTNAALSKLCMTDEQRRRASALLMLAYSIIAGLPGIPCIFYGDEAGLEGYRDPFCRKPFPWENINQNILSHYRKIGRIRCENSVFRDGLFRLISLTDEHIVYLRYPYEIGNIKIAVAAVRKGKLRLNFPRGAHAAISNQDFFGVYTLQENEAEYFICSDGDEITAETLGI